MSWIGLRSNGGLNYTAHSIQGMDTACAPDRGDAADDGIVQAFWDDKPERMEWLICDNAHYGPALKAVSIGMTAAEIIPTAAPKLQESLVLVPTCAARRSAH